MARLEMSILTVHGKDFSIASCLRDTAAQLLALEESRRLSTAFLSIDVGRFGTKKWRGKMDATMSSDLSGFFDSVYGTKMSLQSWEASFEAVSSSKDAGYIALLQKVIVSRAQCVLFVGGGAFQRHALNLYRQLNVQQKNVECLHIVKSCTSNTKLRLS